MARISAKEPGQPGRPPTYGPDDQEAVLDRIATGMTITAACAIKGMPSARQVRRWVEANIDGFASSYAHARAQGAEVIADEALELSLKCMNLGAEGSRLVPAYRLRIECLFRQAAALDPVAYGKQVKHSGVVGHAHGHVVLDATDFLAPDVMERVRKLRDAGQLERKESLVIEGDTDAVTAAE